jgi:hypothetical protein
LLAGCQFGGVAQYGDVEVFTGTEGIEIDLMQHPREVFEGMPFQVQYRIRNKGAHDIQMYNDRDGANDGLISMETEPRYLDISGAESYPDFFNELVELKGKSRELPLGDEARVIYNLEAKIGVLEAEGVTKRTVPMRLRSCYPYETKATTEICIDTDPLSENPAKSCVAAVEILKGGQGAPVAITSVETRMTRDREGVYRPYFDITLDNVGKGQVLNQNFITEFCQGIFGEMPDTIFNLAEVKVKLKGKELDCGQKNTIRIDVDEPTMLRCKPLGEAHSFTKADGTFMTLLQIELNYGYTTTSSTSVDVVRLS